MGGTIGVHGRIATNEFAGMIRPYVGLHRVCYDLHNDIKRSSAMLRRLLSGLGVVEIIITVVILMVVVFAIRQVLQ